MTAVAYSSPQKWVRSSTSARSRSSRSRRSTGSGSRPTASPSPAAASTTPTSRAGTTTSSPPAPASVSARSTSTAGTSTATSSGRPASGAPAYLRWRQTITGNEREVTASLVDAPATIPGFTVDAKEDAGGFEIGAGVVFVPKNANRLQLELNYDVYRGAHTVDHDLVGRIRIGF